MVLRLELALVRPRQRLQHRQTLVVATLVVKRGLGGFLTAAMLG
jgi:hypothetical protein